MKVMITGAHGQVGRALLKLVPANVAVVAVARADLDIADERAVASFIRLNHPDLIINAAAYTAVDKAQSEPEVAELANATGPRNLALAAAAIESRLLHISTDFVFDGRHRARTAPIPPRIRRAPTVGPNTPASWPSSARCPPDPSYCAPPGFTRERQ